MKVCVLFSLFAMAMWSVAQGVEPVRGPARSTLFATGFDNYTTGADALAGHDGWVGTSRGQGLHGVDPAGSGGVGKSGYIGRNVPPPGVTFVSVRRPVNYFPLASEEVRGAVAEFYAIVGIADSTNGNRDNFYITLYDENNRALGAVNFDNTPDRFGIYRYDGLNYHRSPVRFVRGRVHQLYLRINFATGYWSAELDNLPVFQDAAIDFKDRTRTLGAVAAEWEIATSGKAGNNWMLFDEWTAGTAVEAALTEPAVRTGEAGLPEEVSWIAEAGYAYQLYQSPDLVIWSPVSGGGVSPVARGEVKVAVPPSSSPPAALFWRLERKRPPL